MFIQQKLFYQKKIFFEYIFIFDIPKKNYHTNNEYNIIINLSNQKIISKSLLKELAAVPYVIIPFNAK